MGCSVFASNIEIRKSKRHKALRPWSDLPNNRLPPALLSNPGVKAWIREQRRHALPPMVAPKVCLESKGRAMQKLTLQALDWKQKEGGRAASGDIPIDAERMFLSKVEAMGTVFAARGLLPFINGLWKADSPYQSENRLNRFLIKLGRALASKKKRTSLPDWLHKVDQTERGSSWRAGVIGSSLMAKDGLRYVFLRPRRLLNFSGFARRSTASWRQKSREL